MNRRTCFVILLVLTSLITMQSCKKEAPLFPKAFLAAVPSSFAPTNGAIIPFIGLGQTVNLTWTGTATSPIIWAIYFGKTSNPDLVASNVSTNSFVAHIGTTGGTYYWMVETIYPYKISSKSQIWHIQLNSNPGFTINSFPALNATNVSCISTIKWRKTFDPEQDPLTYDLYLGTDINPIQIAGAALTDTTYSLTTPLNAFTDYYWKVVSKDPYGGQSVGPIWKFTTGALPIIKFTGNYNVDEPAEGYSYYISFTMLSPTTLKTTNYWNSGWAVIFTLDFIKLTYSLPVTTLQPGWTASENGIINPATGKMVGTYTIWHDGAFLEQGVHTYTHL